MRPSLAKKKIESDRKVLILGPSEVAGLIAAGLQDLGFQTFLHEAAGERLPSLADPDGFSKLRQTVKDFIETTTPPSGDGSVPGESHYYLHPGTSAWAERPELAALSSELRVQVICPSGRVLSLFSNKLGFFAEAERLGIPNLLAFPDPLHSLREIEQLHDRFPFILKAVKGGSTAAHYVVHDAEELQSKFPLWMEQLRRACGEVMLLSERYLEGARHVVVPFARFQDGKVEIFPVVDASLQCRHRKFIEFCPAPGLDESSEAKLGKWTTQLASACGYVGVGTLEFLVDGTKPFLIGGSARLNHTFHLWEKVAGTSAIEWQIAALEGRSHETMPRRHPERKWASALAIRFYAEDPVLQLPQPGYIRFMGEQREWNYPSAEATLSVALEAGHHVPPASSGLLGLLWVGAQDRKQAITVARGVLGDFWIAGSLQTNERFIGELLSHPWVREGIFHAGFVDEEFLPAIRPPKEFVSIFASVCACIAVPESEGGVKWAVGDQWSKPDPAQLDWVEGPQSWAVQGATVPGLNGILRPADGRKLRVCAYPLSGEKWQVRLGSWTLIVRRISSVSAQDRKAKILALVPGRVHSILFRAGSSVPAHEPILIIESLGMLIPHALPVAGFLRKWNVQAEDLVHTGDELAELDQTKI